MIRLYRLLLICLSLPGCLAALHLAGAAEPETPDPPDVTALVQSLGDDSYEVRRRASEELAALGLKARGALEAGLKDADPEVRRRCRWILRDVLEADYQGRLQAFVDDTEGTQQHDLPGWQRYQRIAGNDKDARKLFAEMQQAESGLLISAAAGSDAAADSLKLRLRQVYLLLQNPDPKQRKPPSSGTTAALLFVSSDPELDLPQELVDNSYLATLAQQADFQKALADGPDQNPSARKLLGRWILRPTGANLLHTKLRLAVQYDIKEGLDLALSSAKDTKGVTSHLRVYAVVAIGQLGGKQHAATLATLLDDRGECGRRVVNKVTTTIEIRDVALAWLVHLTGQSHTDYGQDGAKSEFEQIGKDRRRHLNVGNCGFDDAAKRDKALKKWKEYVKNNPLPKPPADAASEKSDGPAGAMPADPPPAKPKPAAAPGVAAPLPGTGGTEKKPQAVEPSTADRLQVRNLNMAQRLCQDRRYAEAVRLLDEILAAGDDCSFRPELKVPLLCYLKPAAERLVGRLPAEGREAYRLQFEARATELLDRAVEAGSARALAEVASAYFYTRAGAEATYLLAAYHLNHGHPFHAGLYLQRLQQRSWDADRFEPELSATLAACWAGAGMPRAAEEVLLRMQARYPSATVRIAGQQRTMFTRPEQALAWLQSFIGQPHKPRAGDGWPMFRGGPTRNVSTDVGSPFLQAEPLSTICDDPPLSKTVKQLQKEQIDQHRVALPQLHPLVVGETILLRTATHIRALELAGGKLRWESPLEDSLRHFLLLQGKNKQQEPSPTDSLTRGLRRRFWEDTIFGAISSDGRYVFGVEDLAFGFQAGFQPMVVMPDGRRRLDPGWLKTYNLLVAHDVQSGKLKWEIGGPPGVAMTEQAGTFFLGPPLPLGGRLYVIAEVENHTRLLELDAKTGSLVSEMTLAERDRPLSMQMNAFMLFGPLEDSLHRTGTSPSYADGVLVCYTPENHVVAVDLATRAVLWAYQVSMPEPSLPLNVGIALQRRLYQATQSDPCHRWADASLTIAEGRVLLTPPGLDELICLNLADGHFQWSAKRRDGLYLAGADQQNAIVVGRGSVWAVRLADGTPAWPQEVELPADALPSGRGLLGKDRYHLPLTTAEVAEIDLRNGRLVARSRSPDGITPGNLVGCRDSVLSQGVDALRRFQPLPARNRELAAALRQQPDDPQLLCDRGEALLYEGQFAEAVKHLRRAMEIKPTARTQRLLIDVLLDGLRVDFDTFRGLAEQFAPLIEEPEQRARLFQELALALQRAGHLQAALEVYLKLIDLEPDEHEPSLRHFAAAWVVRRDRWIHARLADLRAAVTPDGRAEMDRQITARLRDDRLQQFIDYFGSNPAAGEVRLRLAKQLGEKKQWLEAEQLLRHVLRPGSPLQQRVAVARLAASQQRVAVARMAALLREAKRPGEAARFYSYLGSELADTFCTSGRTGRELLEALPADDPVRRRLTPEEWPQGEVSKEVSERRTSITSRYPVAIVAEGGRFGTRTSVEMDARQRTLSGRDALGRPRWQAPLGTEQPMPRVIWNFGIPVSASARGWLRGHLLVAQLAGRVCAVDVFAEKAKVLWSQEAAAVQPQALGMAVFIGWGGPMLQQPDALPGSQVLPVAVTAVCVCFQQDRKLLAVDPLSGEVLWSRDDLPPGSDLFGDDELLLVTPPESHEAVVLSVLDGRELGRRQVPPLKERVWPLGRQVLTWKTDAGGARLRLVDPWTGQDVWQRDFDAGARPWLVDGGEIGVLEPQGRLVILALPEGNTTLTATVDPRPSPEGIILLRSANRYVLVANDSNPPLQPNVFGAQMHAGHVPVNGRVYGLDRGTGKRLWHRDVQQQALMLDQPSELPVLTFFNRIQQIEENRVKYQTQMLCLDRRNGRVLHSQTSTASHSSMYEIHAAPQDHCVEIRSYLGTVKLTFSEKSGG